MSILVTNDGKGKPQSFQANVSQSDGEYRWNFQWNAEAYGESKFDSIHNLSKALDELQIRVRAMYRECEKELE